jgi:glycosyltransferase involved in cell wall biosynthesis
MDTKPRIAIISSSAPPVNAGGIASAHYNLFKALTQHGYTAKLFTFDDYGYPNDKENAIVRHGVHPCVTKTVASLCYVYFKIRYPGVRHAYQVADIVCSAVGASKISQELLKYKPDLLILPDHGAPGLFIKIPEGCRTILISHHNPLRFINQPLLGNHCEADAKAAVKLENIVLKKVDAVICPSRYMKNMFIKTYTYNRPVFIVPNVMDQTAINAVQPVDIRNKLGLSGNAVVVYIPSAGNKFKGSKYVYEIVRRLSARYGKELGFFLSGTIDGKLAYQLKKPPRNAKLFMPGRLSYAENLALIKSCSFTISPTLIESFGMALLESLFCGLPVVTFAVGGNEDIVINGENGFLVHYLDMDNLISRSEMLLNDDFRKAMSNKALLSSSRFNTDDIMNKFIEIKNNLSLSAE